MYIVKMQPGAYSRKSIYIIYNPYETWKKIQVYKRMTIETIKQQFSYMYLVTCERLNNKTYIQFTMIDIIYPCDTIAGVTRSAAIPGAVS